MPWPVIEFRLAPGQPWQLWAQWGGKRPDGERSACRLLDCLREEGYNRAAVKFDGHSVNGETRKETTP